VSPEDAEIDPAGRLMPAPWALVLPGGDGVPSAVGFDPRFAAAETPRLRRAVERFAAICGSRRGGPTRPLVVECERASPPWPAVDDDEGYELVIDRSGVRLAAAAEWGVLRGLATLAQLCSAGAAVPALRIVDQPRFPWRGLMLDAARHFIPLPDLLRTLDGMAIFKLNVLHLHLSDDQGFRFGSRRYPELASADHYSRDELSELVAAAADRGIRIVPELDVPGHTASWLAAHPEWGCGTPRPTRRFGVHDECLDPTRPAVMAAVTGLFEELAEVFPDRYLHLGGDEVRADWWQSDPAVAAYMARHGLADAAALQSRFTADVAAAIAGLGRRALAWDEVLHPGLPSGLTVQAWRGVTARERALAAGCDCVLSAPYYLDLFYPADVHAGFDPAASLSELMTREDALLDDARFAHVAAGMAWTRRWREQPELPPRDDGPGRLLGAEACLWTELVDARVLDVRLWSRMPVLAERFWSAGAGDLDDLYRRLEHALAALRGWAGIDVDGDVRRLVVAAGVRDAWLPLIAQLEPVKWYGRLLGEEALAARLRGRDLPKARPYDTDTPLDRVVDALPPESLAARRLALLLRAERQGDEDARTRLRALAETWRQLPESGEGPGELAPLAGRLRELGRMLSEVLEGALAPQQALPDARRAAGPVGEYLLAPALPLAEWLEGAPARPPT
jgi:hexosaminidase